MKIRVQNELGKNKEVKLGFSWTYFFWGNIVPLFRGDLKFFVIMLAINSLLIITPFFFVLPLLNIGFAFFYNKLYATDLYNANYKGLTSEEHDELIKYISN